LARSVPVLSWDCTISAAIYGISWRTQLCIAELRFCVLHIRRGPPD
jgi:hypothetical protein